MNDLVLHKLAEDLAAQAGLSVPQSIEPLAGGRNNRVFRISLKDGGPVVLKCYHHDSNDPRDRLRAEWSFLKYVGSRGVRNVPQPLAADPASHSALYSFVYGERAKSVESDLIRQAAEFAVAINQAPHEPRSLDPASEACFSLGDHLAMVDRRVARVRKLDVSAPHVEEARTFVESRLCSIWKDIKSDISSKAAAHGVALTNKVAYEIVSPSDFGFHNALIDGQGRASFLDFEYAGRDDPAKLICDFFCQPELSAPIRHYAAFSNYLAAPLGLQEGDLWRARLLLDAYRIKWVCIMLNEFSSVGARRRAFASAHDSEARATHQLRSAQHYLDLITS